MKQILLIKDKGEEEAIIEKLIEVNSMLLKVYIISTSLPLIANLSAIEILCYQHHFINWAGSKI